MCSRFWMKGANMSKLKLEMYEEIGFQALVNAIIRQAVFDWSNAVYNLQNDPEDIQANRMKADVERFFRSEWFGFMCNLDGEMMMRKIREAFDKGRL